MIIHSGTLLEFLDDKSSFIMSNTSIQILINFKNLFTNVLIKSTKNALSSSHIASLYFWFLIVWVTNEGSSEMKYFFCIKMSFYDPVIMVWVHWGNDNVCRVGWEIKCDGPCLEGDSLEVKLEDAPKVVFTWGRSTTNDTLLVCIEFKGDGCIWRGTKWSWCWMNVMHDSPPKKCGSEKKC